jgi:hypothetical protein
MLGVVTAASNLRSGDNPAYTLADFLALYPQFGAPAGETGAIPAGVLEMYVAFAHACIQEARWKTAWKPAMGLFIAHWCTLYLMSASDPNSGVAGILAQGQTRGLVASKSVGDVSVSYDFSAATQDLSGWAGWTQTAFGAQLATLAKIIGKGGMYVW